MSARRFFLTVIAVSLTALSAAADDLSISFNDPLSSTVHDILWNQFDPSPSMVIGIDNTTGTTAPLFSWQLSLDIVGEGSYTGGLLFKSATIPPSYLLDGLSTDLNPAFSGPSNTISYITDIVPGITGVIVPSTGKNLLLLDFDVQANTSGTFHIRAIPGVNKACWFSVDGAERPYANAPFSMTSVDLGTITVVPEPSTILLLLSGVSVGLGVLLRSRKAAD